MYDIQTCFQHVFAMSTIMNVCRQIHGSHVCGANIAHLGSELKSCAVFTPNLGIYFILDAQLHVRATKEGG